MDLGPDLSEDCVQVYDAYMWLRLLIQKHMSLHLQTNRKNAYDGLSKLFSDIHRISFAVLY